MQNPIVELSKSYYEFGYFSAPVRDILRKNKHTKEDLTKLGEYCKTCQKKQLETKNPALTITQMKQTIFRLIGNPVVRNRSSSTVSRDEMEHIYRFIISLPQEYLKQVLDREL